MSSGIGRMINKGMEGTTSSPTIRVEIYNQTYNIRSDGDSEYVIGLAEFVDRRMREISSDEPSVTDNDASEPSAKRNDATAQSSTSTGLTRVAVTA